MMNIEPKFDPTAFSTNDCPGMPIVWITPFVASARVSMRLRAATVRSSDAESGSCTSTIR